MPHLESSLTESGTLYVVATPIGNLADLSPRARDILTSVDIIAAEDTRVTGQLLHAFGIEARQVSLREHNERQVAAQIIGWLAAGQSVAQVSDAGTPAVSDPGARLVEAVLAAGYKVRPIPGPSAVVAALSASGLVGEGFRFAGFLPPKSKARRDAISALRDDPAVVVFFEAPHRLLETLVDLADVLGAEREAVLARELSKTFETIHRAPLGELSQWAQQTNQARGECVLLLAPLTARPVAGLGEAARVLDILLAELAPAAAARLTAQITGARRQDIYALALQRRQAEAVDAEDATEEEDDTA